jgi:hypothetical protein
MIIFEKFLKFLFRRYVENVRSWSRSSKNRLVPQHDTVVLGYCSCVEKNKTYSFILICCKKCSSM